MKKLLMLAFFICSFSTMPATFAMNSEFQKPDDALEEDVYATPAEEDAGEIIETDPAAPPIEIQPPLIEVEDVQPEQEEANAATTTAPEQIEPVAQPETIQPEQAAEETTVAPVEAEVTAEQQPQTDAPSNDVTTTTTQVDGDEKDIVIEHSNNFWLFVIVGGTVLFIIVLLLFQRLRNNNPYDR